MQIRIIILAMSITLNATIRAQAPVAELRPVIDDYHGVKITDPYRYFENLHDPAVQTWIKGQADHARQTLGTIPGRQALLNRVKELNTSAPYRIRILRRWSNGDLLYLKRLATGNLDKLYFRDGRTSVERLLIDPEEMIDPDTRKHVALQFCRMSPDKRLVAYGLAAAGSEQTTLRILDVATGEDLPDVIRNIESDYTPPYWLPDGKSFVYSRRQKLPPGAAPTDVYKKTRAHLHELGKDSHSDLVVFGLGREGNPAIAETDFPSVVLTEQSKYAIAKIKHGDATELTLYAAPVDSLSMKMAPWKKICGAEDQVSDFAVHGDEIDLMSASGEPRYKIVRTSLAAPDFARAKTILAPSDAVIRDVSAAADAVYVTLLDAGLSKVMRIPFDTAQKSAVIALPANENSGSPVAVSADTDGVLIATESWTRRGRIYTYDPKTNTLTDAKLTALGQFDEVPGYESTQVMVKSHDGVEVPLSIVHKAGLKLDGSHPTLVTGYGAYGHVMSISFNPTRLAWLERGGVLAFAHVRGGGEFGRQWHLAGQKQTKPNTWKDFIACCEYLVEKRYTSPGKLAGQGGSAGGILIGRAITARPDLFAAAIISVGCEDMLRMETTTNGVPNIAEFGSTQTKEGFAALLEMSSFHQVKEGTKYPAVLLTHGINDPRVEPWMSAKMTARLQAATASPKPILFRVDYDAGHGIGSTKAQEQELQADGWAFLLWQMGETGFSAKQ